MSSRKKKEWKPFPAVPIHDKVNHAAALDKRLHPRDFDQLSRYGQLLYAGRHHDRLRIEVLRRFRHNGGTDSRHLHHRSDTLTLDLRSRYGKGRQDADADDFPPAEPFHVGALLFCPPHRPAAGGPRRSRRLLRSCFNGRRHHRRLRHTEEPFRRRNRLLHAQHHAGGRRRTVSGNDLSRKRRPLFCSPSAAP